MSKLTPNQKAFNDIVNRLNSWKKAGEKQGISFPNFPSLTPPKRITKKYLKDLSESVPKTRKKFMETGGNFTVSSPTSSSDDDTKTVSHKAPSSSSSQSSQRRRHSDTGEGSRKSTAPKAPKAPKKPSTSSTTSSSKTGKKSTTKRTRGKDKKPRKKRAPSQGTSSKKTQDANAPKRTRGKDKKPRKKRSPNKAKATAPQTNLFDNIDFESDDWEEIETVSKDEVNITQLAIEYLDNLLSEIGMGINEHTMSALSSLVYSVIEDVAISEEVFEDVETGETTTFNAKAQTIVNNYEANKSTIIDALQTAIYHSQADEIYREGDLKFFENMFSMVGVTVPLNTFIACADADGTGKVYSSETGDVLY